MLATTINEENIYLRKLQTYGQANTSIESLVLLVENQSIISPSFLQPSAA
jgi:hypothetical protein